MKTDKEVKDECIKELEDLIQNIKDDENCNNYSFNMQVLEYKEDYLGVERYVSYGIQRSEYFPKK